MLERNPPMQVEKVDLNNYTLTEIKKMADQPDCYTLAKLARELKVHYGLLKFRLALLKYKDQDLTFEILKKLSASEVRRYFKKAYHQPLPAPTRKTILSNTVVHFPENDKPLTPIRLHDLNIEAAREIDQQNDKQDAKPLHVTKKRKSTVDSDNDQTINKDTMPDSFNKPVETATVSSFSSISSVFAADDLKIPEIKFKMPPSDFQKPKTSADLTVPTKSEMPSLNSSTFFLKSDSSLLTKEGFSSHQQINPLRKKPKVANLFTLPEQPKSTIDAKKEQTPATVAPTTIAMLNEFNIIISLKSNSLIELDAFCKKHPQFIDFLRGNIIKLSPGEQPMKLEDEVIGLMYEKLNNQLTPTITNNLWQAIRHMGKIKRDNQLKKSAFIQPFHQA